MVPVMPLPKAAPIWIKLGIIAILTFLVTFFGLYVYWKIFVQSRAPQPQPIEQTTQPQQPTLPITQPNITAPPLRFFNKLPNKAITIDLPFKDSAALMKALKSEAEVLEEREQVKQIILTYQGRPVELADFFSLTQIFVPQDFLANYENQYAFFFFSQKEGARSGLILKTKDRNLAQNQMQGWEQDTLPSDMLPLFLSQLQTVKTPLQFKSYSLAGQPVRYANVPVPYASLNYSIYGDFLIFTSSSRGMFKVINDLTGRIVSKNYLKRFGAIAGRF